MRKFEASRVSGVGRIDLEEVGYLLGQCRPIETVHFDEAVYKFACNLAGLPATEEETIIDRWLISVVKGRFEKRRDKSITGRRQFRFQLFTRGSSFFREYFISIHSARVIDFYALKIVSYVCKYVYNYYLFQFCFRIARIIRNNYSKFNEKFLNFEYPSHPSLNANRLNFFVISSKKSSPSVLQFSYDTRDPSLNSIRSKDVFPPVRREGISLKSYFTRMQPNLIRSSQLETWKLGCHGNGMFALKQGKRRWILNRQHASLSEPSPPSHRGTSYLGNMGCSRLSSTVTGIVYRGPFCSMFRTIRDPTFSLAPFPRAPSISPSSSPFPTWRPFYTSRRHGTRDIHRGTIEGGGRGTGPKAKGNGTARFRIKLFSLSYPQRQPFCPGKRYSSGCSCYGEGWFPATVGCRPCIRLPLSLTEKEAMEERRKIRGFRSRWRESAEAFQVSLPFTRFMPRFVSGCLWYFHISKLSCFSFFFKLI